MTSRTLTLPARRAASAAQNAAPVRLTVLLPAYNEAEALPIVLADLRQVLLAQDEILVVDDGSTDDTARVARPFHCRVVRHAARQGKGAAIRTGLKYAQGKYIVIMDADATYPASAIPRLVELLTDHDLVRCNRRANDENMPFVNRVGNWLFDQVLTSLHGLDGHDHLSGLYGLQRDIIPNLKLRSSGFDIEAEIGIKARAQRLRVTSFPIDYQPRLGAKKLRPWRDGIAILNRIMALVLLYNPLLTFILPGASLMLLTLAGTIVLEQDRVVNPYLGLSIHSFIVMTLGVLASFQLVVFGMAAALYGLEAGYRPPRWLVVVSSRPIRLGGALIGFGMALIAAFQIVWIAYDWVNSGAGLFTETRAIVLMSTLLVGGMQLLSAALFLSIFAGRLQRFETPEAPEVFDAE
jgi:glycosyltransferase involved in cell wall biosynthesis